MFTIHGNVSAMQLREMSRAYEVLHGTKPTVQAQGAWEEDEATGCAAYETASDEILTISAIGTRYLTVKLEVDGKVKTLWLHPQQGPEVDYYLSCPTDPLRLEGFKAAELPETLVKLIGIVREAAKGEQIHVTDVAEALEVPAMTASAFLTLAAELGEVKILDIKGKRRVERC